MTRTGEAILKAKQEATYPLRFCTVRCGVNPQRHEGHPPVSAIQHYNRSSSPWRARSVSIVMW
jgi:hypothetical protein